jgi:hypothetical protein
MVEIGEVYRRGAFHEDLDRQPEAAWSPWQCKRMTAAEDGLRDSG